MGIKGKTTFELTDVSTGNVEVIEDSNMLTNALQEFLASYGYFGGSGTSFRGIKNDPLWVNGLGGLFLFDTNLDEDVNNTFMPAGVRMIGNGSIDVSNSGAVTELGSYNTTESGLQSDGSVKFVYDFSTQQANGTIACACLTSKVGGYMGMGNEKTSYFNNGYQLEAFTSFLQDACYSGIPGAAQDKTHLLYPVYSENAMYLTNPYNINYSSAYVSQHWSATKNIQILKVRAGFTSVGIKDNNYFKEVMASYDVDIPQDILNYMGSNTKQAIAIADSFERNIYIIFIKSTAFYPTLNANAYCWIMKIDRNMNATAYKLTNNTGYTLDLTRENIVFDGDYLWSYTDASPYKLFGIKYSDSTQIIDTGVSKGSQLNTYNTDNNLIGIYEPSRTNYAPTVYDVVNRTHRSVNGYYISETYIYLIPFADKKGIYIYLYARGDQYQYRIMKDPRYLATINNLSEPVVKTSSKTMKVTYTLTFEG